MDYSRTFEISAAGMTLERTRVEVAAMNLANANTVQGADGARYQPMRVVALPGTASAAGAAGFDQAFDSAATASFAVPQVSVQPSGLAPRSVYEPGNPFADAKGFVNYAGVDSATEMVSMMGAVRSYEANVAAMNMAKTLAVKALSIGASS